MEDEAGNPFVLQDLKAGRIPCLVATSSPRARHRHGRRRPRDPGRVAEVGRARAAADRPRRPRARRGLEGPHLPEVPRRPARVRRSSRARCASGEIEETKIPRNPLDVLAQQIVAICGDEEIAVDELHELVRRAYPFADLSRAQLENVLDMLAGPLPLRRVRRAAAAHRLGPHRRHDPRARRRAPARGHERRHDPRPRPVRRLPRRRRRPRRRARRGDGLRGARRPDVPARRLDLADRGDHARPRARLAGAGRCRARCRSGRARASAGRTSSARRSAPPRASSRRSRDAKALDAAARRVPARRARGAEPAHVPARAGRRHRRRARPTARSSSSASATRSATGASASSRRSAAACTRRGVPARRARRPKNLLTSSASRARPARAPTARSSSSASATRSATGASASSRRSAAACTRRGRWRSRRGCASRSASTRSRSGRTTGSRSTSPTPTRRRRRDDLLIDPDEVEDLVVAELGDTALFGARFRENAGRSLLIPRRRPGRAHAALAAAAQGAVAAPGRAPVRLVPGRARDLPRVPAGRLRPARAARALLHGHPDARARPRRGRDAAAPRRTRPRCSSTTSRPTCTRTTRRRPSGARRRCRSTATCCASCSARRSCATCSTATRSRRSSASCAGDRETPTSCTTSCACAATCAPGEYDAALAEPLLAERRAVLVRDRRRGAADRGRGRRPLPRRARRDAAVGAARRVPRGRARTRCGSSCCATRRAAGRSRPPRRTSASAATSARSSPSSSARSCSSAASCAPAAPSASGATPTCCAGCGARRSPRCAARSSRSSSEALARFLPSLARHRPPRVAARGARPAAGARRCRSRCGSREVLPRRVPGYRPEQLDALCATRRGRLGRRRARPRRALLPRGRRRARPGRRRAARPRARRTTRIRAALERGALFWLDLLDETGLADEAGAAGAVGSRLGGRGDERRVDAAARGRGGTACRSRSAGRGASRAAASAAITATQGRWSRDRAPLRGRRPSAARSPSCCSSGRASSRATASAPRASPAATARSTRSCARSRRSASAAAATSSRASAARSSRSAAPSSACASCATRDEEPGALVLAAADPAQPYGAALPWPKRAGARAARVAGAHVVLARRRGGALRRARRPLARPAARPRRGVAAAGARRARRRTSARGGVKRLAVERFDGEPVAESDAMPLLVEAGFLAGPRRAVLRPSSTTPRPRVATRAEGVPCSASDTVRAAVFSARAAARSGAVADDSRVLRRGPCARMRAHEARSRSGARRR